MTGSSITLKDGKLKTWGWSYRTVGRALTLHRAKPGLMSGTPYGPPSPARKIPEDRT